MNIGRLLFRHAKFRRNHPALIFGEERITFGSLNSRVNQLANGFLKLGIRKDDKVATVLNNCVELLEVFWAAAKIGAVAVPLSPLLIYSSGTTGLPKGIVHTHYIRGLYCSTFASSWRMRPESICLHTGSVIFNGAFMLMMPAMYLGSTFIFGRHLDGTQLVELIEKEKITHVTTVPAQIIAMLNASNFSPKTLSSMEAICCMGAPLHKKYKDMWNHRSWSSRNGGLL